MPAPSAELRFFARGQWFSIVPDRRLVAAVVHGQFMTAAWGRLRRAHARAMALVARPWPVRASRPALSRLRSLAAVVMVLSTMRPVAGPGASPRLAHYLHLAASAPGRLAHRNRPAACWRALPCRCAVGRLRHG